MRTNYSLFFGGACGCYSNLCFFSADFSIQCRAGVVGGNYELTAAKV